MKPNDLQVAFTLIDDFKQGRIAPGAEVSVKQIKLLRLLCEDLLPVEKFAVDRLGDLVAKIAYADTNWNRRTQLVIDEFYSLREAGKADEALLCRQKFLEGCPSKWYRDIVEAL